MLNFCWKLKVELWGYQLNPFISLCFLELLVNQNHSKIFGENLEMQQVYKLYHIYKKVLK